MERELSEELLVIGGRLRRLVLARTATSLSCYNFQPFDDCDHASAEPGSLIAEHRKAVFRRPLPMQFVPAAPRS